MQTLTWRPYDGGPDSTAVGDVRVSDPLAVEYLDLERELLAYLPPSYADSDREYPVVYMHDGQNVFDEATSNASEWAVDETMERLAPDVEAIVIAIPDAGAQRPTEYSPFFDVSRLPEEERDRYGEVDPRGEAYADWLVETVVPLVEDSFRVSDDRSDRGLFGSSMGGLMSLYSLFRDPDIFGFAGAMSPAAGGPWADIFDVVESAGYVDARLYVDVGGDEFPDNPTRSTRFEAGAKRLVALLEEMGYDEQLRYVYDPDAIHHEDAWGRRFPDAIRFLLG